MNNAMEAQEACPTTAGEWLGYSAMPAEQRDGREVLLLAITVGETPAPIVAVFSNDVWEDTVFGNEVDAGAIVAWLPIPSYVNWVAED
ncbi:hypothetical protein [Chelatococcus reniformis]|uniref:DUF551 domain-containing protein n=1 Tax=Chelatococcus reniformis TaxID=1494448 RepID=A0A916XR66_9HYPH|nr:hypothetical protein [Chelatococcus reniformis]GGC94825.1 hypothetical protein GCM10010994_60690 [Chelatococcus reniformis]